MNDISQRLSDLGDRLARLGERPQHMIDQFHSTRRLWSVDSPPVPPVERLAVVIPFRRRV